MATRLQERAMMFQHTAARRRLGYAEMLDKALAEVSTHSRPKAAGWCDNAVGFKCSVSTHSRPKAAGKELTASGSAELFQHTAARRRLEELTKWIGDINEFQHTAARRRLGFGLGLLDVDRQRFNTQPPEGGWARRGGVSARCRRFNTQPPEGGWALPGVAADGDICFNTQPPEGGWRSRPLMYWVMVVSTHSRPKAAGSVTTSSK